MKKHIIAIILLAGFSTGLALNGCRNTVPAEVKEQNTTEALISGHSGNRISENALSASSIVPAKTIESTDAVQGGPYGRITLTIPSGWRFETYPTDSGQLLQGMYGIHFYPEDASSGYIELTYTDNFGVCGTGLDEKTASLAGQPVSIGTYDSNNCWNFISFGGNNRGIVALTYDVDDWWETYNDQVMEILDTLSFDPSIKEGGAYIHNAASEINKIGLYFTLNNISSTGATLVFNIYDTAAPTGELTYSDAFVLEVQKDGTWQEAPIILEGSYSFNAIAHMISPEKNSEQELSWKWLYGTLSPGNYRIKKSITDFRDTGDYDEYTVYAQFVLN